ncbi:MAG: glycosyltransferase family 39 protein, partial [Anaerolineae bacterium]
MRRLDRAYLMGLVLLALALRLYRLEAQPIWWDEAISLHLSTSTISDLLADRAAHIHPPLYFLLLKGWVTLASTSVFSVRFLSVWFNTLLVAAVCAFGCRHLDRRTGLAAAFITAISPLYIVYSQEARVYAMLPLGYLTILALVNRLTRMERPTTWRGWMLLAGVEATGLYLHYVFLLAIAYANLILLFRLWRRRRQRVRWIASLALVVLLCLPWAITVFLNREAVRADIGADDPFAELLPLDFFLRLLWTFQWSGITAAPGYPPLYIATLILASLLLATLTLLLTDIRTRTTTLRLLGHWLAPLTPALLMWQAKPLSHPRYVALFAVVLFLLVAYLLTHLGRHRPAGCPAGWVLSVLLSLALLTTSSLALHAWYFVPRFAKDDVSGLAAWLEAETAGDDLIVAPWQDWSLDYAYHGPASISRQDPADEAGTWGALMTQAATARRVFLVDYHRATRDARALLPFALESAGSLVDRRDFKGLYVRVYRLDQSVAPPEPVHTEARFGPLRLTAGWIEPSPAADTAVTLALSWRLEEPISERYRVGVRLRDPDGWER